MIVLICVEAAPGSSSTSSVRFAGRSTARMSPQALSAPSRTTAAPARTPLPRVMPFMSLILRMGCGRGESEGDAERGVHARQGRLDEPRGSAVGPRTELRILQLEPPVLILRPPEDGDVARRDRQ